MITNHDEHIMNFLKCEAINTSPVKNKFKLTAGIYYKNSLISIGYASNTKTHPLQKRFGKNAESLFIHAEIDAIIKAIKHLTSFKKTTLYVFRVKRQGKYDKTWIDALACPCPGCQKAILEFEIPRIIYSHEKGYVELP